MAISSQTKIVGAGSTVSYGAYSDWIDPTNIQVDDDSFSTCSNVTNHQYTDYLKGLMTGNEFTIPTGSVITGIEVNVNAKSDATSKHKIESVYLYKDGTNVVGSSGRIPSTTFGTSLGTLIAGGKTEMFGTTWTAEEINSSNFGARTLMYHYSGATNVVSVDFVSITVYYAPAGTVTLSIYPVADNSVTWGHSTGATNYGCIDETTLDDADYVSIATNPGGHIDIYDLTARTIPAGATINSVTAVIRAKRSTTNAFYNLFKIGGTSYLSGNTTTTTAFAYYYFYLLVSPATSSDWTVAEANAFLAGFKTSGSLVTSTVSRYYVEICYTPIATGAPMLITDDF
jgi:hypothetical protein